MTDLPTASPFDGLCEQLRYLGLPAPERETLVFQTRRWRFDGTYRARRLAIELEGGTWSRKNGFKSRHTTGSGHREDCIKYNIASLQGWTVLRFTSDQVKSGVAARVIAAVLAGAIEEACDTLSNDTKRPRTGKRSARAQWEAFVQAARP